MVYPDLTRKLKAAQVHFGVTNAAIGKKLGIAKDVISKDLGKADRLTDKKQRELVGAICEVLDVDIVTEATFRIPSLVRFCVAIGLSRIDAVLTAGYSLPIPDVFLDNVLDVNFDASRLEGHFIVFRHDKERDVNDLPYIQGYAEIRRDTSDRLAYSDNWVGRGGRVARSEGFVFYIGTLINIVGQTRESERSEIWWCGLKPVVDSKLKDAPLLYGYVSDVTSSGNPYTDRIILKRINRIDFDKLIAGNKYYANREELTALAGTDALKYISEWENVAYDTDFSAA